MDLHSLKVVNSVQTILPSFEIRATMVLVAAMEVVTWCLILSEAPKAKQRVLQVSLSHLPN